MHHTRCAALVFGAVGGLAFGAPTFAPALALAAPDQVVKPDQAAKPSPAAAALTQVDVQSLPPGVTVAIDGKDLPRPDPPLLELAPGVHKVVVRAGKRKLVEAHVEIPPAQRITIDIGSLVLATMGSADPTKGRIEFLSRPAWVGVNVDSKPVAKGMGSLDVAVGTHVVQVVGKDRPPMTLAIHVRAGRPERIDVSALAIAGQRQPAPQSAPTLAWFELRGAPFNTVAFWDGKETPANAEPFSVGPGAHKVVLKESGRALVELDVVAEAGKLLRIDLGALVLATYQVGAGKEGWLDVQSIPTGIDVHVGGQPFETTGRRAFATSAGVHRIRVSGYRRVPVTLLAEVRLDRTTRVDVSSLSVVARRWRKGEPWGHEKKVKLAARGKPWAAYVAFAASGALATGLVFGLMSNRHHKKQIEGLATAANNTEPMRNEILEHNSAARRNAIVANVAYGVGAAGALVAGLLMLRSDRKEATATSSGRAPMWFVAPTSVSVQGAF